MKRVVFSLKTMIPCFRCVIHNIFMTNRHSLTEQITHFLPNRYYKLRQLSPISFRSNFLPFNFFRHIEFSLSLSSFRLECHTTYIFHRYPYPYLLFAQQAGPLRDVVHWNPFNVGACGDSARASAATLLRRSDASRESSSIFHSHGTFWFFW